MFGLIAHKVKESFLVKRKEKKRREKEEK